VGDAVHQVTKRVLMFGGGKLTQIGSAVWDVAEESLTFIAALFVSYVAECALG
jgi:hypothetical protein